MKKIKVIQIIDSLNVGGAEVLAVNIANGLLGQNIESHFCTTRKEGPLKDNLKPAVGYLYLKRKSTFDINAFLKLKTYIKSNGITIVHAHTTSFFIAYLVKFLIPKIKVVWHNHTGANINLKGLKLYSIKFFSKKFDAILSVNRLLNQWSKETLKHSNGEFLVNFPKFTNNDKSTFLKGLNGKRIICLAGFRPEKDHVILLKAFKQVLDEYSDWSLHLVGKNYQDNYSHLIETFIEKEGLTRHVFLYGLCFDIKNILSQATIGVLSSKSEGLPISLLEYGLAKIPVVVTNVGECSSVLENNTYGLIVPPINKNEMAVAIKKLIESPKLRLDLSNDFYEHITNDYSEEKIIHKLIKIYNSI